MSVLGCIVKAMAVSLFNFPHLHWLCCYLICWSNISSFINFYKIEIFINSVTATPRVTNLRRTSSTTNLTLTCTSTYSPATTVTWMKDGDTLDIDGVKYKTYQTVTSRQSSTYQNVLVVDDVIENITGTYTCKVTNKFGSSNRVLTVRGR